MYLLDSSVLITANKHDFPIEGNPGTFWGFIEDMGSRGQIRIPEAVFNEIVDRDANLFRWLSARRDMFLIPTIDALPRIAEVLHAYGPITDVELEHLNGIADPYLVAHALVIGATVVTNEASHPGATSALKKQIPDICSCLGVSCIRYPRFLWEMSP